MEEILDEAEIQSGIDKLTRWPKRLTEEQQVKWDAATKQIPEKIEA
jgi:hypothetical protein